jgi:hypothetical protein
MQQAFRQAIVPVHRSGVHEGVVLNDPSALGADVFVRLDSFNSELSWGPCPWEPQPVLGGLRFPAAGDRCLVVISQDGEPWIVNWQSQTEQPSATPVADMTKLSKTASAATTANTHTHILWEELTLQRGDSCEYFSDMIRINKTGLYHVHLLYGLATAAVSQVVHGYVERSPTIPFGAVGSNPRICTFLDAADNLTFSTRGSVSVTRLLTATSYLRVGMYSGGAGTVTGLLNGEPENVLTVTRLSD